MSGFLTFRFGDEELQFVGLNIFVDEAAAATAVKRDNETPELHRLRRCFIASPAIRAGRGWPDADGELT